ncbi:MAG TPA: BlaI/MecI/CopY family transcriptional regulator [Candidatus Baltobacteraceae bacterium]|nr:BlaI/MecI/CopY family transcriptional regulator [Candidatus Baltobacteraceae bacterium]
MPRAKSEGLTEVEQRVMEVLWTRGDGTVSEVLNAVDSPKPLAFNTVQTMLRILEQKGYLRHTEEGRAFRYFPLVDRAQASRSAVQSVVRRFFGSPGKLALNLLQSEQLTPDELAHIRRLIQTAEGKR